MLLLLLLLHTHVLSPSHIGANVAEEAPSHNRRLGTASRNLEVARRVGQYCKTQASRNNVSRHARQWRLGTIFQETNTLTSRPCINITECKERPAATAWTAKESLCLGCLYMPLPIIYDVARQPASACAIEAPPYDVAWSQVALERHNERLLLIV